MIQIESLRFEGTPEQLAVILWKLPRQKRYKLIEIEQNEEVPEKDIPLIDPLAAASIDLLNAWIAEAPTDPIKIQEAEEELLEFKRNINLPRKQAGARLIYPEAECLE